MLLNEGREDGIQMGLLWDLYVPSPTELGLLSWILNEDLIRLLSSLLLAGILVRDGTGSEQRRF